MGVKFWVLNMLEIGQLDSIRTLGRACKPPHRSCAGKWAAVDIGGRGHLWQKSADSAERMIGMQWRIACTGRVQIEWLGSLHLKYHYWTRYGRNSHGFCAKRGGSGSLLGCDLNCIKMVRQKILDNICRNDNLWNNQPIFFEENRCVCHKVVDWLTFNEFHYA